MNRSKGVANTYGDGSLETSFTEAFFRGASGGVDAFTMNRTPCEHCGVNDGFIVVVLKRAAARLIFPALLPIAQRQCSVLPPGAKGRLRVDHTASVRQVFAWLDETPSQCGDGPMRIEFAEQGTVFVAYIFGFVGNELFAEVRASLQPLGVQIEPPGAHEH